MFAYLFVSLWLRDNGYCTTWIPWCASGCVVECRICSREVAGSNLSLGYFAPRSTQPSIPPGSVNEYQLRLGRQRQVWLIPIADERVGVQVKLWNPLRTRAIPERFCDGDSLRSVCTFTFTFTLATEKPLDFGGNPDHVTLESGLGSGGGIFPMGGYEISGICLTVKIFATSAALAEVCALLSAVQVYGAADQRKKSCRREIARRSVSLARLATANDHEIDSRGQVMIRLRFDGRSTVVQCLIVTCKHRLNPHPKKVYTAAR